MAGLFCDDINCLHCGIKRTQQDFRESESYYYRHRLQNKRTVPMGFFPAIRPKAKQTKLKVKQPLLPNYAHLGDQERTKKQHAEQVERLINSSASYGKNAPRGGSSGEKADAVGCELLLHVISWFNPQLTKKFLDNLPRPDGHHSNSYWKASRRDVRIETANKRYHGDCHD